MHWDWLKAIGGMFRIGAVLLIFSFVVQNLTLLNKLSLVQLPAGSLLLLILSAVILHDVYRTFAWYFTWLRSRKKVGSITNVIIHFCLYAVVFFVTLSVPVPTLVSSDQPDVTQPDTVDKITPGTPDDITAMPSSNTMGYNNRTVQHTVSNDTDKSYRGTSASNEADRAHTVTQGNISPVNITRYMTSPKKVNYEYVFHGNHYNISYTVYGGMNDYLKGLPRYILYRMDKSQPTDIDFIMKDLDNKEQKPFIDPLVKEIENITPYKDDQVRIAVSLVQNIDYDSEGLRTGDLKGKYPYEVLYTGCGVCSEKSELLAYILREMGYGVVMFRFEAEKHDAVGIKCPDQYSYRNTGYCFVESTSPSIITYSSGDYLVIGNSTTKLTSMPKKLKICNGDSFDGVSEEYNDAQTWDSIGTGKVLDEETYNKWLSLVSKYGIKTTKAD
jgi:hypothetical protein